MKRVLISSWARRPAGQGIRKDKRKQRTGGFGKSRPFFAVVCGEENCVLANLDIEWQTLVSESISPVICCTTKQTLQHFTARSVSNLKFRIGGEG